MLSNELKSYIASAKGLPFFYVVGDDDYCAVLDELKHSGLSVIRNSDFCINPDRYPSIEELIDYFRTSDVDYRDNKFVVVGLGESLALRGGEEATAELMTLKSTTLGNARVVLLLRAVASQAIEVINNDKKILGQQRAFISENALSNLSVTSVKHDVGIEMPDGIKALLHDLEDGAMGNRLVRTSLPLSSAIIPINVVDNAHSALKHVLKGFNLPQKLGTDEFWNRLLQDIGKCNNQLSYVFEKYDIDNNCFNDFYNTVSAHEYKNWLFFIWLKTNSDAIPSMYLKEVVAHTDSFEDFKSNILNVIIGINHVDKRFERYYKERKQLVKDFPESDVAGFIKANEEDPSESIYKLTDNTLLEKKAIIKWLSMHGKTDALEIIYPALNDYLKKYFFSGTLIDSELTEYYDQYKKQKISNKISDSFMDLVYAYASNHIYTKLPTRNNVIKALPNKEHTQLYWIDALGVEYMSYFSALAKKKGLSMKVDFATAQLPSITSMNKQFYDEWTGGKKYKEERLDDIKHNDSGGYYFTEEESPIHLAAELEVIAKAMDTAATELAMHHCQSFVIASDHGASRLAVIKKQEEKYESDTKGEHSGRCCKEFDGCDLPNIIPENGYIVLSDYGRFKGSRAANVEVHGGASLEEIIVPVISLSLKKQSGITITVLNPNDIFADRHLGITVNVYISDVDHPNEISMIVGDKKYIGETQDGTHFSFIMADSKRAKTFDAEIYDSSDLIGKIKFTAKGKTGSVNSDFEDLF